ncbi:MAG: hypothetical protein DCC65_04615 [Planctomycetota bacterium]|nr:MAG: hypothetical protein DCC65_04615 [Planctomycetota bacterium]
MPRRCVIWVGLIMLGLLMPACGEDEEEVQERKPDVRVRAPFTKVDVYLPDDDDEEVEVDVDVDD